MTERENNRATVLVADDDESSRDLLCTLLNRAGYQTVAAADGDAAQRVLAERSVELALLDVMMPGRTGFEVCRAIKMNADTRLVPVVLVTGLAATEDRVHGIEAGADDFLSKPFAREELLARVRSLVKLKQFTDELESAESVVFALARAIEAKDPYTEGHCDRLARLSVALADRLGLPEDDRVALRRAGVVHDVGKVAVPEQILLKAGPLTAEERKVMEQHPVVGERICMPLHSFRNVLPIIRHHHEHRDGSGYPDGLRGEQIPLTARVLQTVDVFDALTTDRPYRCALSSAEAFATMREEARRGWWDSSLVEAFAGLIERDAESAVENPGRRTARAS